MQAILRQAKAFSLPTSNRHGFLLNSRLKLEGHSETTSNPIAGMILAD